jgi:hypothetical protein
MLFNLFDADHDSFFLTFLQVIEPLESKQWFVTMEPLAEKALSSVEKGQLTILPERFEKVNFVCETK